MSDREKNGLELTLHSLLKLRDLRIGCNKPVVKISYKNHEGDRTEATKKHWWNTQQQDFQNGKNNKNDHQVICELG